jgi:hypothetical protein
VPITEPHSASTAHYHQPHYQQHKSRRKTSGEKSRRGMDKGKVHQQSALARFPSSPDRNGEGATAGSPGAAAVRRRWSWDGELDHALLDLKDDHYFSCAVSSTGGFFKAPWVTREGRLNG